MKPRIAVVATSKEDKTLPYMETITHHGGNPICLHPGDDFKNIRLNGILLTGGGDVTEKYYDHALSEKERNTLSNLEPEREDFELTLLAWASKQNLPVLGICRGCQVMNLFTGGNLIPDIPIWQETHRISPILSHRFDGDYSLVAHDISIETSSLLSRIFKNQETLGVNTSHHQALNQCGSGLVISARAPDGIIEAVENPHKNFWLGVQFHPERMWKRFPIFSNLFHAFTEHAQQTAR